MAGSVEVMIQASFDTDWDLKSWLMHLLPAPIAIFYPKHLMKTYKYDT
jgi:hypothetical protein